MSLKIKIPKAGPSQSEGTPTLRHKPSKRRQAALYSDDEDGEDATPPATTSKPSKRARTEEPEEIVEVDVEAEEEVNVDDEGLLEDTRFLPPEASAPKRSSSRKPKPTAKRPKKRAVVLSDDEGEDDDRDPEDIIVDDDDDDFTPEPSVLKRSSASKSKSKSGKAAIADKPITLKDERKAVPSRGGGPTFPGKRGVLNDDADAEEDSTSKTDSVEVAAPPPKKPKLPPIKKNKPLPGISTPTGIPGKPPLKSGVEADGLTLGVAGARKPAATANNADFDLRDASVYASLFMKPGGSTPNSGPSRKEKEEERRRELNRMREEARHRREAEAQKDNFDLQAAQEKISRFEAQLRSRLGSTSVTYPNVLGGAFKDTWERAKAPPLHYRQPAVP